MPRRRQARRCTARRTNGLMCGCFAIVGGLVCAAHGGRAPQVRAAAERRRVEEWLTRGLAVSMRRHRERMLEWQARRVAVTAELMGVAPEQVTPAMIGCCSALDDRPELAEPAPELEFDRRYGPRLGRW